MTPFSRANASSGSAALGVAHLGDVGMPEERVVVDGELRVERLHLAVRRHDQRVDLAEHRVRGDEAVGRASRSPSTLGLLARVVDPRLIDEAPPLERLVAHERVDVEPRDRAGVAGRDLLDLDAALRREHEERLLLAAVEGDREVVLLRDLRRVLDPELADDVAADVEAEDLARLLLGVLRGSRRA